MSNNNMGKSTIIYVIVLGFSMLNGELTYNIYQPVAPFITFIEKSSFLLFLQRSYHQAQPRRRFWINMSKAMNQSVIDVSGVTISPMSSDRQNL